MKTKLSLVLAAAVASSALIASADGIPEPGLVMYGTIRNTPNNARVTTGTLTWTFTTSGSSSVVVTVPVTDVGGQYSYILRVPFETLTGSSTAATNTFRLNSATTAYTRATVSVAYAGSNYTATIQSPALTTFNFNASTRGAFELVDLAVNIPSYPSNVVVNPNTDTDGDGMTDAAELIAGTDPGNPNSVFRFTSIQQLAPGQMELKWASASNKSYAVLRAISLTASNLNYTVVRSNIIATPSVNTFIDTNAPATAINFYRLTVQ